MLIQICDKCGLLQWWSVFGIRIQRQNCDDMETAVWGPALLYVEPFFGQISLLKMYNKYTLTSAIRISYHIVRYLLLILSFSPDGVKHNGQERYMFNVVCWGSFAHCLSGNDAMPRENYKMYIIWSTFLLSSFLVKCR